MRVLAAVVLLGAGSLLSAQDRWEMSVVAGGSLYGNVEAARSSPSAAAKAGFFKGGAAGAVVSQTGRQRWGGEFRYLFQSNNMRLRAASGASGSADFSGQSHSFHYDVLLYATPRAAAVRPFLAAGVGLKLYQADGQERAFQPLNNLVIFTRENDLKFLGSLGGGVKFPVHKHALVRLDFRDYITGIPKGFTGAPGARLAGQFHNLLVTGGIGIVF